MTPQLATSPYIFKRRHPLKTAYWEKQIKIHTARNRVACSQQSWSWKNYA